MKKMTVICFLVSFLSLTTFFGCEPDVVTYRTADAKGGIKAVFTHRIPAGGNSWVVNNMDQNEVIINNTGIHNWQSNDDVIRTYFYTETTGNLLLGLNIKVPGGITVLDIGIDEGSSQEVEFTNRNYKDVLVGEFTIDEPGYHYVEINTVSKSGSYIGDINEVLLGGSATSGGVTFIENEENFYFGRRGPSDHLSYDISGLGDIEYFYNEITVPEGYDPVGSYFMADGFAHGYFGIQVNSETERRVLFSVWSPYDTDDPSEIPEDQRIQVLEKGENTVVGEFGNEGSGGQSFLPYMWEAGTTYGFLLKGVPNGDNSTNYSAYFMDPEVGEWILIATFKRPQTDTYLRNLHSFLENFSPNAGYLERKVNYTNQWAYAGGSWTELTGATFTVDNTGNNGVRLDFDGGDEGDQFFLRNTGFFTANTQPGSTFTRTAAGNSPTIDLSNLPVGETTEAPVEKTEIDRSAFQIVDFSTEETAGEGAVNGRAATILDGDVATYWHSCWSCDPKGSHPHHITVDMGENYDVDGFYFYQRQNLSRAINEIEIHVSDDNSTWTNLGTFNLANTTGEINVDLSETANFRYFKIVMNSSHDGNIHGALAEVVPFSVE